MNIAAILKIKGHDVASVHPDETIAEVSRLLAHRRIGAVVVVGESDHLLGILSERDIVQALAVHGAAALQQRAEQLMTRDVKTTSTQTSVHEAMQLMTTGRFRHLPVVENGEMIGLISIGDVVKHRIMEQEHEVDSLKAYVAGSD